MRSNQESLTIGGIARAAGVNVETVRFYQRKGLLREPSRAGGGIRRYGEADVLRLQFIRSAQRLGFSLAEITDLLRLEDGTHCAEARALAEHKLVEVQAKLASLARLQHPRQAGACMPNAQGNALLSPYRITSRAARLRGLGPVLYLSYTGSFQRYHDGADSVSQADSTPQVTPGLLELLHAYLERRSGLCPPS